MLDIYLIEDNDHENKNKVGRWIQLPLAQSKLAKAIAEVLPGSKTLPKPHEVHNTFIKEVAWENEEFLEICGYENLFELNNTIKQLSSFSRQKQKAIAFLLSKQVIHDLNYAIELSENITVHENQSITDIAHSRIKRYFEHSYVPYILEQNLNFDGVVKDLESSGNYWTYGDDVFECVC